jgi:hypothetical protein
LDRETEAAQKEKEMNIKTPEPILREMRVVAMVHAGTLFRAFRSSRGIQRYPFLGIAFDLEVLRKATAAGATRIKLYDRDTGATYETDMDKFRKLGFRNPTNAEQWIMKLPEWKRREPGEEDQEIPAEMERLPDDERDPIEVACAAIIAHSGGKRRVQGKIDCPVCQKAEALEYSIESNGQVLARCATETCVRWME